MSNLIPLFIVIIIISTVILLTCKKDGSPGNWSTSQKKELSNLYYVEPYKTSIFTYIADTLGKCGVQYLTRDYHYKILLKHKLTENEHKKLCEKTFGTRENWLKDFYFHCENELAKNLPRECASCIMQNLTKLISPYGFLLLIRNRNEGDEKLGATATLAMTLQMSIKNCKECAK